jgi:hypothetical protein
MALERVKHLKKECVPMTKVVTAVFAAIALVLGLPLAAAQLGCCGNVEFDTVFCQDSQASQSECCPSNPYAGGYDSDNPYRPVNQLDCETNYWAASCSALGVCEVGCCGDQISIGDCINVPEASCKEIFQASSWVSGFPPGERLNPDDPCYNLDGVAALSECQTSQPTCSSLGQADCVSQGCYWCPSQSSCVTSCGSCSSQPQDSNGDHICDGQAINCDDSSREASQSACFQDDPSHQYCRWCEHPSNGDNCRTNCDNCHDGNYDIDHDGVCDTTGTLTCSQAGGYCCDDYDTQCSDAGGSPVSGVQDSCLVCCDVQCYQIPDCQNNARISSTALPGGYTGPYCMCGSVQADLSADADKYCCDGSVQTESCTSARIFGYVRDPDSNPLVSTTVTLIRGANTYTLMTDTTGLYSEYVSEGLYVITAAKGGYDTYQTSLDIAYPETQHDIVLYPIQQQCNLNWPSITLTAELVKCQPQVNLQWNFVLYDCTEYLDEWRVYRSDGSGFQSLATLDKSVFSYTDSVQWDTTYEYYVEARYTTGENRSNTQQINPGAGACAGQCGNTQFCIDDDNDGIATIRARCNDQNGVVQIQDCRSQDPGAVCVMENQQTYCRLPEECTTINLDTTNPLGMYYTLQECHHDSNGQPRFCYYDASETTADSCHSCAAGMFCYDYGSGGACSANNCKVSWDGQQYQCTWYSGVEAYGELGKGVCFAPRYNGTDFCDRCGEDTKRLFANTHCDSLVCDLLGGCRADENDEACLECKPPPDEPYSGDPASCADYRDERACIGSSGTLNADNQPFSIQGCSGSSVRSGVFIHSNDACSLGVCKWSGGRCFKDANDDDQADCDIGDENCEKDTQAPVTTQSPTSAKVNRDTGSEMTFSITDYGWGEVQADYRTFYCIDADGTCCPNTEITGGSITLSGDGSIPGLVDVTNEDMHLRFFSVDGYDNVEAVRSADLDVDTKQPGLGVQYEVQHNPASDTSSDVSITITSDEGVGSCVDSLTNIGTGDTVSLVSDGSIGPGGSLQQIYTDLPDGNYLYEVQCTDGYGNVGTVKVEYIEIDRVQKIANAVPIGIQYTPEQTVEVHVESVGEALQCYYQQTAPTQGSRQSFPSVTQLGNGDYQYEIDLTGLSSGSYMYTVECEKNGQVVDSAVLFFTVDGIPPKTELLYEYSTGNYVPFEPDRWYEQIKMKLECDDSDPVLEQEPGPFGCGKIVFCVDESNSCTPDQELAPDSGFVDLSGQTRSFWLRYYSEDAGGNKENLQTQLVKVDGEGPELLISSPMDGTVVNDPVITISGSWEDESTEVLINIVWTGTGTQWTSFRTSSKQFSQSIQLYPGENIIKITATDSGVQGGGHTSGTQVIRVYYDTIGPEFIDAEIVNHQGARIDNSLDTGADYAMPINFTVFVDDPQWTREVTSARFRIECIDQSLCGSNNQSFSMRNAGNTTFVYALNPLATGILSTGPYRVLYVAADRYGNENNFSNTFIVTDSSALIGQVYNHLGERVDDFSHQAEYGKPVTIIALPSKFEVTSTVDITISCIDAVQCGDYQPRQFSLARRQANRSFELTLDPTSSGVLYTGTYNVTFTATDNWGKKMISFVSFTVADTSGMDTRMLNHLLERIDDASHSGHYGRQLHFNVTPSERGVIRSIDVHITCVNKSQCSYDDTYSLVQQAGSFFFTLTPGKDANGIYRPDVGRYYAFFEVTDAFGLKTKSFLREFAVTDTLGAVIDITIDTDTYDLVTGRPKVGVGDGAVKWYDVVITSNKPIDINSLVAEIFRFERNQPPPIDFNSLPVPTVSATKDEWTYKLTIPFADPNYRFLRGRNTKFVIGAVDMHGIAVTEINSGGFFEIDTHGGDPPHLFTEILPVHITSQSTLVISGILQPQEPTSTPYTVYLNLSGQLTQTNAEPNAVLEGQNMTYLDAANGSSAVKVRGNHEQLFSSGRYVQFGNHKRRDGMHYRIMSSAYSFSDLSTTITLQPALEAAVSEGTQVFVYDREKPTGWFSFTARLAQQGENPLSIWAVDEMGNKGLPTERIVIYDSQAFNIHSYKPHDGSVIPDKRPEISIAIADDSTDIVLSSVVLHLNNVSLTCGSGLSCVQDDKYVIITHMPTSDLQDGLYQVQLEAEDSAGNHNSFSWEFTIDSTAPALSDFTVRGGVYHPHPYDRWYANNKEDPEGRLGFTVVFEAGTVEGEATLSEMPGVVFSCEATGTSVSCESGSAIPDGDYELVITASKDLGDELGNAARYTYFITIDTVPPQLAFDPTYPSRERKFIVTGTYSDTNMDERDVVTIGGAQLQSEVVAELSAGEFLAELFLRAVPEGNYTVTATAFDKAGNTNTATAVITYDLSVGPIQITAVESNSPDLVVVKETDALYYTNVGTLNWGIMLQGVAESGTLSVYTSYRRDDNTTSEELLQVVVDIQRAFEVDLTLGHNNGENYIRLVNTDHAGNNNTLSMTIVSDITGPEDADLDVEGSETPIAHIGSTGMDSGGAVQEPDVCLQYATEVERDTCLINLLLAGAKNVCPYISNYYLRVSCEALS